MKIIKIVNSYIGKIINKNRIKPIILNIFIDIILIFLIFPLLLKISLIRKIFSITTYDILPLIIIFSILLVIYLNIHNYLTKFWRRISKNYSHLKKPPFTIFEHIVFSLIAILILAITFQNTIFKNIYFSDQFIFLFICSLSLVLVFLLFSIISAAKYKEKVQIEEYESKKINDRYLSDDPIDDIKYDLLGRKNFIESLAIQIRKFPHSFSYVIGLYDEWGKGKTSTLNMLKDELNKTSNELLFIKFDPWIYENSEAILKGFYEQIYNQINQTYYYPDIKKPLKKYHKILKTGLSQFPIDMEIPKFDDNIETAKARVEKCIQKFGIKILIAIDDIDSLTKNEILLVFKVVKIAANFKKFLFILSYDPKIVIKTLNTLGNEYDPNFLEKIVQQPIYIPKIEQADLDEFFFENLERIFLETGIEKKRIEDFAEQFRIDYFRNYCNLYSSLRKIKIILNKILFSLPPIKNEINLYDFCILEMIKDNFPEIYNDIYVNWWFYVSRLEEDKIPFLTPLSFHDEEKANEIIAKHIEKQIDCYSEETKKQAITTMICRLFQKVDHALSKNKYNSEDPEFDQKIDSTNFLKYFIQRIPKKEISDEYMKQLISEWNVIDDLELKNKLKEIWQKHTQKGILIQLFNKIKKFSKTIESITSENIISTLSQEAQTFTVAENQLIKKNELREAEFLILYLLENEIPKEKINSLIEKMIENSHSIILTMRILVDIDKVRITGFHNLRENCNLNELRSEFLKLIHNRYTEEHHDMIKEEVVWDEIFGVWSSNFYSDGDQYKKEANDYIFSLIDENPKYLGLILDKWIKNKDLNIDSLKSMEKYFDLEGLYHKTIKYKKEGYSKQSEKEAINLFIESYENVDRNSKK